MATLKHQIEKLEDVPEGVRDFYVERKRDGKSVWEIQVEGVKTQGDVDRVTVALDKERADHKVTKDALTVAKTAVAAFGDADPATLPERLERLATLEATTTKDQKKIEETIEQQVTARVRRELGPITRERDTLKEANSTLTNEVSGFKTKDTQRTIDDVVRAAAIEAKVHPTALADVLVIARSNFAVGDGGKVVTQDGLTAADWMHDQKTARGYWWPTTVGAGASGAGGGTGGEDNPWSEKGWNVTKQGAAYKADAENAKRLAEAAGSKIGASRPTIAKRAA